MRTKVIVGDPTSTPICDFCSQPNVKWTAFSTEAEMNVTDPKRGITTGLSSDGEWAVCDACVEFLRANDHVGLGQRSHETDPVAGEDDAIKAGIVSGCFHRTLHEGLSGLASPVGSKPAIRTSAW